MSESNDPTIVVIGEAKSRFQFIHAFSEDEVTPADQQGDLGFKRIPIEMGRVSLSKERTLSLFGIPLWTEKCMITPGFSSPEHWLLLAEITFTNKLGLVIIADNIGHDLIMTIIDIWLSEHEKENPNLLILSDNPSNELIALCDSLPQQPKFAQWVTSSE